MTSDGCAGTINAVNHLEHIQCKVLLLGTSMTEPYWPSSTYSRLRAHNKVSLTYVPRGNLMLVLTSPSGTRSTLLFPRPRDTLGSRWWNLEMELLTTSLVPDSTSGLSSPSTFGGRRQLALGRLRWDLSSKKSCQLFILLILLNELLDRSPLEDISH